MRTPTEQELQHLAGLYDPVKAHKYYEEHKKLKGRNKGLKATPLAGLGVATKKPFSAAKTKQRQELAARIGSLSSKLARLEARIRKMEHEAAAEDRKGKAKKERAAKESDKPKTAAEKAKAARENDKYRDKHKQELKNKEKKASDKSGGGKTSETKNAGSKDTSIAALKSLATRVKGQIAVAKQKLAAL